MQINVRFPISGLYVLPVGIYSNFPRFQKLTIAILVLPLRAAFPIIVVPLLRAKLAAVSSHGLTLCRDRPAGGAAPEPIGDRAAEKGIRDHVETAAGKSLLEDGTPELAVLGAVDDEVGGGVNGQEEMVHAGEVFGPIRPRINVAIH